jgi:hypothetical protein
VKYYDYYSELHNRLLSTMRAVRDRPDRLDELLAIVDDVPIEQKEDFEIAISVFLERLRRHHEVWSKVLEESRQRKTPTIRRIK